MPTINELAATIRTAPVPTVGEPVPLKAAEALVAWLLHPDRCSSGALSDRYVPAYLAALIDQVSRCKEAVRAHAQASPDPWEGGHDCALYRAVFGPAWVEATDPVVEEVATSALAHLDRPPASDHAPAVEGGTP